MRSKMMSVSAVLVIALMTLLVSTRASAAIVWSDNFNDGNYNDWTVDGGGFTAANGYLECTESGTGQSSRIHYNSTVNFGSWSFDFFYTRPGAIWVSFWGNDLTIATGILFIIQIYDNLVLLYRNNQELGYWDSGALLNDTWTTVEVTMDESYAIDVFVSGINRIHYAGLDPMVTCLYFSIAMNQIGQAVDNIVVNEQQTTDYTTGITTSTTTTSTTTPPPQPLPLEIIGIIGGAIVVVLVVLVIFMKRR